MKTRLVVQLIFCFVFAFSAAAQDDPNRYVNNDIGLSISKPGNWFFLSAVSMRENRNRVRLKDEELTELIANKARLPLVIISKYQDPASQPDVTPTGQVVMSPLGKMKNASALDIINMTVNMMKSGVSDFKLIEEPSQTKLSGFNAGKTIFSYSLSNQSGGQFEVKSRLYVVVRGDFGFTIGLSGPLNGPDVSDNEFSKIISSLKIEN